MDAMLWSRMHGATTHFPIALVICSAAFDGIGFLLRGRPVAKDLHTVGYWTMLLGAAGSCAAVVTGIVLTRGEVWGHGMLRMHHLFVWPAFGLLVALATWRVLVEGRITRVLLACYLMVLACAMGLVCVAGFWGGELISRA